VSFDGDVKNVEDNDVSVTLKIGRGCGCPRQSCQIHTTAYQPWQEYHTHTFPTNTPLVITTASNLYE
jgi:hypothetical protein